MKDSTIGHPMKTEMHLCFKHKTLLPPLSRKLLLGDLDFPGTWIQASHFTSVECFPSRFASVASFASPPTAPSAYH